MGPIFERNVTKFAPLQLPKLITCGKLTFDGMVVLHRVHKSATFIIINHFAWSRRSGVVFWCRTPFAVPRPVQDFMLWHTTTVARLDRLWMMTRRARVARG